MKHSRYVYKWCIKYYLGLLCCSKIEIKTIYIYSSSFSFFLLHAVICIRFKNWNNNKTRKKFPCCKFYKYVLVLCGIVRYAIEEHLYSIWPDHNAGKLPVCEYELIYVFEALYDFSTIFHNGYIVFSIVLGRYETPYGVPIWKVH